MTEKPTVKPHVTLLQTCSTWTRALVVDAADAVHPLVLELHVKRGRKTEQEYSCTKSPPLVVKPAHQRGFAGCETSPPTRLRWLLNQPSNKAFLAVKPNPLFWLLSQMFSGC